MDREIKFRGYSINRKKWVYGGFNKEVKRVNTDYIIFNENFSYYPEPDSTNSESLRDEVYEESVGQYTGYEDHKDNPIYEGDIIQVTYDYPTQDSDVKETVRYIVRFEEGQWCLVPLYYGSGRHRGSLHETMVDLTAFGITVIGNEYENSDMIREYR